MLSPFKFLDAYKKEDRDQFFGREEETNQLFELVNQNRLVLIYGPSGTGKTSLIQCGLGNKFDSTDWLPFFIRREGYLPHSLQKTLVNYWGEDLQGNYWEIDENPLPHIIEDIFSESLRPVYLIFDQLEELFILGDEIEESLFVRAMADIYHAKLPCRLIFVLREEYLAHLYELEKKIPTLFKRRMRVESMSTIQAEEVVMKSCERFNIDLENPNGNASQIINKISSNRSGVVLPYLQVYLDRLYRENFSKKYPHYEINSPNQPDCSRYPIDFTTKEIEGFGEIEDILKIFLQEQTSHIEKSLEKEYKNLAPRAVRKVLNDFASIKGTKIPRTREEINFSEISDEQISIILNKLLQSRILREQEGIFELVHDSLAEEIANLRSGNEQSLLEIFELIRSKERAYKKTQTFLDAKELQLVESFYYQLKDEQKFEEHEWDFIEASKRDNRKKRQNKNRINTLIISTLSILLAFSANNWYKAESRKDGLVSLNKELTTERNSALRAEEKADSLSQRIGEALKTILEEKLKAAEGGFQNQNKSYRDALRLYGEKSPVAKIRKIELDSLQQLRDSLSQRLIQLRTNLKK